ncbi:LOW QUALITY PROTEIN: probable serine/threonine-protein kinase tsuA [Drosophila tropicalis]|uniref:LOW QUALITY PROTEIN: probable serine/threonine-protein kinase tsuA n=1 Tax=Drosophila tropicalis TaxID=46794 RepID=UPI0035ABA1E1
MSSGLMSCVRENSPPLELEMERERERERERIRERGGPLSLPSESGGSRSSHDLHGATTSTPISSPVSGTGTAANDADDNITNADNHHQQQQQQQKRRRFHPLRNLRRIFRRRTINTADSSASSSGVGGSGGPGPGSCNTLPPPASSSSEKNLRNVTTGSNSSQIVGANISAISSPASPLNSDSYQTQSLPKSKSHRDELLSVLLGKKKTSSNKQQQQQQRREQEHIVDNSLSQAEAMYQTQQRQQLGVAVFPDSLNLSRNSSSSYYAADQRQRHRHLRSVGDSSQEFLMGESNSSAMAGGAQNADMSDSQRSLSEGRLLDVDGDYTRETLSQSHDSVFSESATASSLSIVLKAELTDVLRKRRNRPDASDEDLGLPRSPASPQRRAAGVGAGQSRSVNTSGGLPSSRVMLNHHHSHNHSVSHSHSEVSSLSLLSVNSNDDQQQQQHSRVSTSSSISMGSDILRFHPNDETDAVGGERHRLSHAAAKHKMAIRPAKKKGPSRQHRRTLETSIPEANEELLKMSPSLRAIKDNEQVKSKTRSLPPKTLTAMAPAVTASTTTTTTKRTKTIDQTTSSTQVFGLRSKVNALFETRGESSTDGDDNAAATADSPADGFLSRLIHRNSKRSIARANDGLEDVDSSQSVAKKLQISTSCLEATSREPLVLPDKSKSATSHEQHIHETRQIIKREIQNEGRHGLNAMVSNYGVQPQPPTAIKPKSGPAARQRYVPQELSQPSAEKTSSNDVTNLLSKSSRGTDTFQSTTLVREQQFKSERKTARIVGLSAFQQKLSRSNDSVGQHSSSSNSLETSTDEPSPLYYEEKQRKTVEKSRSFRNYQEEREATNTEISAMPSLPDLSISFRVPSYYKQQQQQQHQQLQSPQSPTAKCVSLGFEINDNKLLQSRAESSGHLSTKTTMATSTPSPQHSTKLLVTSGTGNISQIEQNIDMIVKSPLVNVLRKSATVSEHLSSDQPQRPKVLDIKPPPVAASVVASPSPASPLAKNAKLATNSPPSTPTKTTNSRRDSLHVEQIPSEPEFMKIQLNRVDQARLYNKTNHLVLAKNVKVASSTQSNSTTERSQSTDDLSHRRRNSDEVEATIEIVERPIVNQRAVSANSVASSPTVTEAPSVLPPAVPTVPKSKPETTKSNRLSLDDRKRLFLNEDTPKVVIQEQRKKSLSKVELSPAISSIPPTPSSPTTPESSDGAGSNSPSINPAPVVLRKKSFGSSINGNAPAAASKEDATPELMKVFARRSLKVKDEEVVVVTPSAAPPTVAPSAPVPVPVPLSKKSVSQNVDSDKENQSNSEEKLDKLQPKYETQVSTESPRGISHHHHHHHNATNNRNSVADFRNLNNNINNNNNQQQQKVQLNGLNGQQQHGQQQKVVSYLPPIKISQTGGGRNNNNNINNNNNNTNTNGHMRSSNERYSLQLKPATATSPVTSTPAQQASSAPSAAEGSVSKAIERSATVGEFKGIHQRRAEWEQRAKEALK